MKNPLFYLLITLYALTACSNGEDYREPTTRGFRIKLIV